MRSDAYRILGISKTASKEEIHQAYRKLVKKYHPDLNPSNAEKFAEIKEAYESLNNESKPKHNFGTVIYYEEEEDYRISNANEVLDNSIDYDLVDYGKPLPDYYYNDPMVIKTRLANYENLNHEERLKISEHSPHPKYVLDFSAFIKNNISSIIFFFILIFICLSSYYYIQIYMAERFKYLIESIKG